MGPQEAYTKRIRREAMKISVALMSFYAVNLFVTAVITVVFMLINYDLGTLASAGTAGTLSPTYSDITDSLPWGWLSIAGLLSGSFMLLIVRGTRLFTKDLTKTSSKIHLPDYLKLIALILGVNALISLGQLLLTVILQNAGSPIGGGEDIFAKYFMNGPGLLYVVLLGPIIEEVIFRGAILRSLEPFGQNFAIVVSSLLFGLYHLILFQGIFAFFIGLVLAYCALRFSIKWSMLLHMLNNGYAMLMTYLDPSTGITAGIFLLLLALGLLSFVLGFPKLRLQMRQGKPTELCRAAQTPLIPSNFVPWDPRLTTYIKRTLAIKPRPFKLTFSSAWIIVALSLATFFTLINSLVI